MFEQRELAAMPNKYYLLSKDTGDGAHLIGELERIVKGEYRFSYLISGAVFPEWFMQIPGMPDMGKVYGTDEVKEKIIHRVTPRSGSKNALDMMAQNCVPEYDEWDLLESQMRLHEKYKTDRYPLSDSHQIFYFYPEIPQRVNRYD